jgi:ABC-type uncharacterized transport system permease subunit
MIRSTLLFSSLSPLMAILAIRLSGDYMALAIVLTVMACGSAALLPVVLKARGATSPQPYTIAGVKDESGQVPAYVLAYIFPFLFVTIDNGRDLAAYVVFAALLVVLLLRTDLALVNPLLLAAGYHLYAVETNVGRTVVLVSRERPMAGNQVLVTRLSDSTYKLEKILP